MLLNFALTLPGRAPVLLVAPLSVLALPIVFAYQLHAVQPEMIVALVPAFIGAFGGKFAGRLLDTAAAELTEEESRPSAPWYGRPLSRRVLLAVTLSAIAAAGLPIVRSTLVALDHRAASWLALVWQIMTLLGWIICTPLILAQPRSAAVANSARSGTSPGELIHHAVVLLVLAQLHAALIVTIPAMLWIPVIPDWSTMAAAATRVYTPLDALAYLAILALGYASDIERQRREAVQRESALRAETLDSRLTALRARLNPHFLFNALNSVHALANAGRAADTSHAVERLTDLLRYVLDDRNATVPLSAEVEFIRAYLALQRIRFGERLRYEVDVDPECAQRGVPQLLLQPIVENAIEHGISQTLDGGTVKISAATEGDRLRVTVEDTGPGPSDASPERIGLGATRERLDRLFGNRARLAITPRPDGSGTRVSIVIPLHASS